MELTLDQALKQAVAAHKEGKLQDAERLYRAILQSQPNHPDANHNLGVLAVAVGKPLEAVPFFKQALDANPQIEQFWLSYIDTLFKVNRNKEAREIGSQSKRAGLSSHALEAIEQKIKTLSSSAQLTEAAFEALTPAVRFRETGRFEAAQHWLREYLKKFPDQPEALSLLSEVLLYENKTEESEAILATAVKLDATLPSIFRNQARLELRRSEFASAEKSARLAFNQDPLDPENCHVLAMCLAASKQDEEALSLLKNALEIKPDFAEALGSRAYLRLRSSDFLGASEDIVGALSIKPHLTKLWELLSALKQQAGDWDAAEQSLRSAVLHNPNNNELLIKLAALLTESSKHDDAVEVLESALTKDPQNTLLHLNIARAHRYSGRLEETVATLEHAVTIDPDFVEAHFELGNSLIEIGEFTNAADSYKKAIALRPNFASAYSNMGNCHRQTGKPDEALSNYLQAVAIEPGLTQAKANLGELLRHSKFAASCSQSYEVIADLLSAGHIARPSEVAISIISLLRQDPAFDQVLVYSNSLNALSSVIDLIESLEPLQVLHCLMRLSPIPDLEIENIMINARKTLLRNLAVLEESASLVRFFSTLALHCLVNEYVFFESEEEKTRIQELEVKISRALVIGNQPIMLDLLSLCTYRPLHKYNWSNQITGLAQFPEIQNRLVDQPQIEAELINSIEKFGSVSDTTSKKVKHQYEENPYPRWIKVGVNARKSLLRDYIVEQSIKLFDDQINTVDNLKILVAGCGTGQQAIEVAGRFTNSDVTAIDLSAASLAFAKSKTRELGIDNVQFLLGDILNTNQLGQRFDIIECTGVLHHMLEPSVGWRALVDVLKPGGLMQIGLYSDLARRHITKVKDEIASKKIGCTENEIREFRRFLAESRESSHMKITTHLDFFSMSELRDLLFHAQEHRFTIPQIEQLLQKLGLDFCGFRGKQTISNFLQLGGNRKNLHDLSSWHDFEMNHPDTFIGMYQFWCQKGMQQG
jgi:tetratricopeptide (TPR) repeat protein/2-polyprenyl-3-methyl-5-hydroxy-6-metoxy-1,4-benzoquinol methylase